MNKYKFLGAILHIVYRILSFTTRKEYFFANGVEMNNANISFSGTGKFLQCVMPRELLRKKHLS